MNENTKNNLTLIRQTHKFLHDAGDLFDHKYSDLCIVIRKHLKKAISDKAKSLDLKGYELVWLTMTMFEVNCREIFKEFGRFWGEDEREKLFIGQSLDESAHNGPLKEYLEFKGNENEYYLVGIRKDKIEQVIAIWND